MFSPGAWSRWSEVEGAMFASMMDAADGDFSWEDVLAADEDGDSAFRRACEDADCDEEVLLRSMTALKLTCLMGRGVLPLKLSSRGRERVRETALYLLDRHVNEDEAEEGAREAAARIAAHLDADLVTLYDIGILYSCPDDE